ncbi:MAG: sulfurtransferase [Reyranellaceae bacterium]
MSILQGKMLVDTAWLAAHLTAPGLRLFDCTTHLRPDPARVYRAEDARAEYRAGHIPGAAYIDLQGEFSDPASELRFTLPQPPDFAAAAGALGIGEDCDVVLYSATSPMWATRVWWMLRAMGFDRVAVLDGGLAKWQAEGRALESGDRRHQPAKFTPRPRPHLVADKHRVLAAIDDGATRILNALTQGQHAGNPKSVNYGRPGHIAGSVCVPAMGLVREDGTLRPPDELRQSFAQAGIAPQDRVVAYCGGGIAATLDAFALALLGNEKVAVYDNSLSEWATDPSLPMRTAT